MTKEEVIEFFEQTYGKGWIVNKVGEDYLGDLIELNEGNIDKIISDLKENGILL